VAPPQPPLQAREHGIALAAIIGERTAAGRRAAGGAHGARAHARACG
jgi:hypothetical protein